MFLKNVTRMTILQQISGETLVQIYPCSIKAQYDLQTWYFTFATQSNEKKMFQLQHNFICNGKFKDWRVKVQTVLSITCSGVITVGNQFLCVLCFFSPVLFLFPFPPEKPWTFPVFLWYCICTSTALIPPHHLMLNRKQITFL